MYYNYFSSKSTSLWLWNCLQRKQTNERWEQTLICLEFKVEDIVVQNFV